MKKDILTFILIVIGLFILASFITSCNSQKACERKLAKIERKCPGLFNLHNTDSTRTVVKETKSTDTILLPGTAQTFTVSVPCPTGGNMNVTHHFKEGTASATINNGILTVKCPYDSLMEVYTNYKDSVFKTRTIDKSGIATRTLAVFSTHWYDYFCRTVVAISLLFLIIWVVLHALKLPLP